MNVGSCLDLQSSTTVTCAERCSPCSWPVSSQWLWEQAGQVRSFSESSGSIREISVCLQGSTSQNACGINSKDEDFSLSDEVGGTLSQASMCILLQYAGLRLMKLLNWLQSLLSSPLSYNCRISCGLELVCSRVGFFLVGFFFLFTLGFLIFLIWQQHVEQAFCCGEGVSQYNRIQPFVTSSCFPSWCCSNQVGFCTEAVEGVCILFHQVICGRKNNRVRDL